MKHSGGLRYIRARLQKTFRLMVVFFALLFIIGCVYDDDKKEEIKEKVRIGRHEEAERLAHTYFDADKLILMVMLEYIADQKDKAIKKAYKDNLLIDDWEWWIDRQGLTKVAGRVIHKGDKSISGFGIKIYYIRNEEVIDVATVTKAGEIEPGMYKEFEHTHQSSLYHYDEISLDILDFGIKD